VVLPSKGVDTGGVNGNFVSKADDDLTPSYTRKAIVGCARRLKVVEDRLTIFEIHVLFAPKLSEFERD
jgi:hypothetical protein